MKKVLFCIVCLNMALLCFGQPVKVKLVAEREAFVLFGDERYDLKKGETRWITLEGEAMYGRRLWSNEECFLFLEAGDVLEVVLHENNDLELKDDGSLCATRNNWLRNVNLLKQRLQYSQFIPQLLPKEYEGLNLERACDSLNVWLATYLEKYPADRRNFEKVMRTEFKYYRLLEENNMKFSRATFQEFSKDALAGFAELIPDAEDDRVVHSPSYWRVVEVYVDYLRVEDPRKLQGKGDRIYENELKLAKYFPKGAVRDKIAYTNLDNIFYWVRPDSREEFDKCVKRLAPRYAVILQEKLNKQDAERKDRKLVPENLYPSLSGENVDGERVDLSSFKGSWILLDVWATWCGPCCNEIPYLAKMEERLQGRNIEFVSLSVDKSADREKWIKMVREKEMKGVQLRLTDKKSELNEMLCISGIPHFAIIDPQGKLVWNALPGVSYGLIYRILKEVPKR
ncbi:MAG TPA: TlpA family protein disulfide reductase [Butyricimonas virosa]|uniref:TlpA family protein disulfide reductase n=1 Tax=Butyricimonas virosa TaxID=544645 RepID=A0A921KZ36_9BACT|nr:TlpA family protein disulfide reductase [Butyricimonas virosa]